MAWTSSSRTTLVQGDLTLDSTSSIVVTPDSTNVSNVIRVEGCVDLQGY